MPDRPEGLRFNCELRSQPRGNTNVTLSSHSWNSGKDYPWILNECARYGMTPLSRITHEDGTQERTYRKLGTWNGRDWEWLLICKSVKEGEWTTFKLQPSAK